MADAWNSSSESDPGPLQAGPAHRKHRRWLRQHAAAPAAGPAVPAAEPLATEAPPEAGDRGDATAAGLQLLLVALALGALGDGLLRAAPWGLNVLVWAAALAAGLLGLAQRRAIALRGEGRWLVAPLLIFAAAFAWRDSTILRLCNGLALLAALSLGVLRSRAGQLRAAGLFEWAVGGAYLGFQGSLGLGPTLFGEIKWKQISTDRWYGPPLAVGRGLAMAVPLLFVFGGLFVSADAAFESVVRRLFGWDPVELIVHGFVIAWLAWVVGGLLRVALARAWSPPSGEWLPRPTAGTVELGVVLGLLDLLFLAFVCVQAGYLFGGAATVVASAELTYAEYARRGFFELVTVSALVLPLLLLAHWLLDPRQPAQQRTFRPLAGGLVALLFLVMLSAVSRMRLYQELYGQTELRLYTTAFMAWLAALFVWFLATVLRGRRRHFAVGALVSGFIAVALLDALNPDGLIVRTNAGRVNAAEPLDERYVAGLSADAVPDLIDSLPSIPDDKRPAIARQLLACWSPPSQIDWRSWSWSRATAWQAVGANEAELRDLASRWQPAAPARGAARC